MVCALWNVRVGDGYAIEIYEDGELLERYTAGDSLHDSAVHGTGDLAYEMLVNFAVSTARDMLDSHGETENEPQFDPSLSV